MQRTSKYLIAGAALIAAAGAAGVGVVSATGGDDDVPITGAAYDTASAAALDHTGEGRVTDTEVGDEEGYYEVEVTLDDGSEVDVHLNEDFDVIGTEAEVAGEDDEDDDNDD